MHVVHNKKQTSLPTYGESFHYQMLYWYRTARSIIKCSKGIYKIESTTYYEQVLSDIYVSRKAILN
jgi:hypothetical protein